MMYRAGLLAVTMLILTSPSWALQQAARDIHLDESPFKDVRPEPAPPPRPPPPPFPAPPAGSHSIGFGVMIDGQQQIRHITYAEPSAPARADEDGDPPPARPVRRLNLQTMVLERENFDRWLFADALSAEERWTRLEDDLRTRVEIAARMHKLTDPQRAKLLLAGSGDIKRFFDRVEMSRGHFEVARKDFNSGFQFLRGLDPLTQVYREGPFGNASIFSKTLRTIIDREAVR